MLKIGTRSAVVLGLLAGMGTGAGALMWLRRPADGARDERAAADMLREVGRRGLEDGAYEISDPGRSRVRSFARDPASAGTVQILFPENPTHPVPVRGELLMRHLLGDVEQFLRGYRVTSGPVEYDVGTRRMFTVTWRKRGARESASRQVWIDAATGRLVRLEEREGAGMVFHEVRFVGTFAGAWTPRPMPPPAEGTARTSRATTEDFLEFVRQVPFPVYEPAQLPPGFRRDDYRFDDRPPAADREGGPLPIAWISYSDGMLRMHLFLAAPEHMKRLQTLAGRRDAAPGASECPTTPADAEDDVVGDPDAVTVHRRRDGCRTVLRRDDLPGVAAALVGYPGIPEEDCLRAIRALVCVPRPAADASPPAQGDGMQAR